MAKSRAGTGTPPEAVISVIGAGMKVTGSVETDGAVRIDGSVDGDVRAGKSVVIGKGGLVEGNIQTQDAILSGRVTGAVVAESRLEVQSTAVILGDIQARRMQLEEGAGLQGRVSVGEHAGRSPAGSSVDTSRSPGGPAGAVAE